MYILGLKRVLLITGVTTIATAGTAILAPVTQGAKAQQQHEVDWKPVEEALGKSGQPRAGGGADLHDGKFTRNESTGVDLAIKGLAEATHDDQDLLERGMLMFDGLYTVLKRKT